MKKLTAKQTREVAVLIDLATEKMKDFTEESPAYNIGYYGGLINILTDLIISGYDELLGYEFSVKHAKKELQCGEING